MLNKAFLSTISRFINSRQLLNKDDKCLVTLSGGADSVALTLALQQLGYKVEAAHCNFHLRGEESDRDEKFCVSFCEKQGIELHIAHFDTTTYAKLHKVSIEMAARELRYAYFRQLKRDINATAICVAHHRDDSVETVLMNLIRGTGVHGLTGIAPKNDDIVRPLLCVSRRDIEDALSLEGQSFVTDSTNLIDDVVRNKIRLDIIPALKQINPSVSMSIAKTAERMSEVAKVFDDAIKNAADEATLSRSDKEIIVSIPRIKASASAESVLFFLLKDLSFSPLQIEQISRTIASESGKTFTSATHQLLIDRERIIIEPLDNACSKSIKIPEEGVYVYDEKTKFRVELVDYNSSTIINKVSCCLCADASKVHFPLIVRTTATGDRFIPFGMKGSKLVSDFLTDLKLNLFDKSRQLVMTDASGEILWVVGRRTSNRCRITPKTKTMLRITCSSFASRKTQL